MLCYPNQLLNRDVTPVQSGVKPSSNTLTSLIAKADRWRERYNALEGLTIELVKTYRMAYLRGQMPSVQWCYNLVERSCFDLKALKERRLSAITKLDWNIKQVSEDSTTRWDEKLAEDQKQALREAYESIDNLPESIEHLALATFRGFAHLEKHRDGSGRIIHFEPLDQWNVCRNGYRGAWRVNPDARDIEYQYLDPALEIPPENWVIREVTDHINWLGILSHIREGLIEKDWDAFCEAYNLRAPIIEMPELAKDSDRADYEDAAEGMGTGGGGVVPFGSKIHQLERGNSDACFKLRLEWLREQLIFAGTGGKLTMLSAPTGIGSGASDTHADVFNDIAQAEAKKISSVLQKQFDKAILEELFPGKPVLAYFDIAATEETDVTDVINQVKTLKDAGYKVSSDQVAEKTGYELEEVEPLDLTRQQQQPTKGNANEKEADKTKGGGEKEDDSQDVAQEFKNRVARAVGKVERNQVAIAALNDLEPIKQRILQIQRIENEQAFKSALIQFSEDLPQMAQNILHNSQMARELEKLLAVSFFTGYQTTKGKQ
jgi:phage gp29-like protein